MDEPTEDDLLLKPYSDDAWKQHNDLVNKFTARWAVRNDLVVTAKAYDRSVELSVSEYIDSDLTLNKKWHVTRRNVGTMRELAQALEDACDFVEKHNPEWAKNLPYPGYIMPEQEEITEPF